MYNNSLIPVRFLILIAHFSILVTLLWSSRESARSCLTERYIPEVLETQHDQLIVGLGVAIGLLVLELVTFLTGVTMFQPTSALLSIGGHGMGSIVLTYFIFNNWQCSWFWWIFTFTSVLPILYDSLVVFDVVFHKKY